MSRSTRHAASKTNSPTESGLTIGEKRILSELGEKIDFLSNKISTFETLLAEKNSKIEKLEEELVLVKSNFSQMEERFDEIECEKRNNSIIISGGEVPAHNNNENCVSLVDNLIRTKLQCSLGSSMVTSAYRIGSKPNSQREDRRSIIAKFSNEEIAQQVIRSSRTVKPTKLYFSENLIPKRSYLCKILRSARKNYSSVISGCSSIRGKIYVWLKTSDSVPGSKNTRIPVNNYAQLKRLCQDFLKIDIGEIATDWPFSF